MQLINQFSQYWRSGESGLQALSRGEDSSICYVDPFAGKEARSQSLNVSTTAGRESVSGRSKCKV